MEFKIKFRPLQLDDAYFINRLRRLDEMEKMIGGSRRPVSLARDQKWVEDLVMKDDQSVVFFAITELYQDEIIGYASIADINYRNGTCSWGGIKIDPSKAGKGYGKQTGLLLIKYAFEDLRMVRFSSECQEYHLSALHMMLNIGFVKEGLMRKTLFKNGQSNNQWLLSIIDTDFETIKLNHGI